MENTNLFLKLVSHELLLKKLCQYISLEDASNLSYTCKYLFNKTISFEDKKNVTFCTTFYTTCQYNEEKNITFSKIRASFERMYELFVINKLKKVCIKFDKSQEYVTKQSMIDRGKELNKFLQKNLWIEQLILDFSQFYSFELYLEEFFNQINNKSIKVLGFNFESNTENHSNNLLNEINSENLFIGLPNLKKLLISIDGNHLKVLNKIIIDGAKNRPEISIEIELVGSIYEEKLYYFNKIYEKNIISHIIKNGNRVLIKRGYHKAFHLNIDFNNFNGFELLFIQCLTFDICSYNLFYQLIQFLSDMVNLEYLSLCFKIENPSVSIEKNIQDKLIIDDKYDFRRLQKLKTLKMFIINECTNEEERQTLEKNIFKMIDVSPNSINNLYLHGINKIKNEETQRISKQLLNIKFLYLGNINEIDQDCLINFKNLKIFISCCRNVFQLPKTIEAFMVMTLSLHDDNLIKLYHDCCSYYELTKNFNKIYTCEGYIKGKIFFNTFIHCLNIQKFLVQSRE
uniref:F-box domain-containing protein n=1 Tax=Strongyloides stercoralis TaxID=6248 RepID=A0A0K0E5H4_STRER